MKYFVNGYYQPYVVSLRDEKQRIDCIDLTILSWFVDFKESGKMKFVEVKGKRYYWVSYDKLLDDLPILGINKRALYDRFQKLVKFGLLSHYNIRSGGSYSYYAVGTNYYNLLFEPDSPNVHLQSTADPEPSLAVKCRPQMQSNADPLCSQLPNKDRYIINNNITDRDIDTNISNTDIPDNNINTDKSIDIVGSISIDGVSDLDIDKNNLDIPCDLNILLSGANLKMPLKDGTEYEVSAELIDEYKLLFKSINVDLELQRARRWLLDNPHRGKTKRGIKRYIYNWLSNEERKAIERAEKIEVTQKPKDRLSWIDEVDLG